jgi:DNA repair protein RadD
MVELNLRDYQNGLIKQVGGHWEAGRTNVCIWLATGGGKTEIAVALALAERKAGGHTLFIVDRTNLCGQGAARFEKYGLLADKIRGDETIVRGYAPVTVASVQSLRSRKDHDYVQDLLKRVTLIIIDEAHIHHKHHDFVIKRIPGARVVGLTATPLRDGMGKTYQAMVRGPSYADLIEKGHLVKPRYYMPNADTIKAALKKVSVASTGDYSERELSAMMRAKAIIGDVVGTWKNKAEGRQTIVFCVDVAHAEAVAEEFQLTGVEAHCITYRTPEDLRQRLFAEFERGKITILCSVAALAVGFDSPRAGAVVMARPTLSLALKIQQEGRGLRPFDLKSDCLIFDHAQNVNRHGKIEEFNPPELNELDRRSDKKKKSDKTADYRPCPECSAIMDPHQRECHECGFTFKRNSVVHFEEGELSEGEVSAPVADVDLAQRFYLECRWICRSRGYKEGAAYFKAKERFPGITIPFSWKDLEPRPPSDDTVRWWRSQAIKFAKSRQRAAA